MNEPQLLHCPRCTLANRDVNLGSVTSQGYLIIRRKQHRDTMILAENYSVICDCGYAIRIKNGMIAEEKLLNLFPNG